MDSNNGTYFLHSSTLSMCSSEWPLPIYYSIRSSNREMEKVKIRQFHICPFSSSSIPLPSGFVVTPLSFPPFTGRKFFRIGKKFFFLAPISNRKRKGKEVQIGCNISRHCSSRRRNRVLKSSPSTRGSGDIPSGRRRAPGSSRRPP